MMFGYHGDDEVILAPPAPPTESDPDWGSLPCEVVNLILQFHKQNNLDWWIDLMKTRAHEGHYLCPPELKSFIGYFGPGITADRSAWRHPVKRPDYQLATPHLTAGSSCKPIIELHVNRNYINHKIFGKIYDDMNRSTGGECLFLWGRLAVKGYVAYDGLWRPDGGDQYGGLFRMRYVIKSTEEVDRLLHQLQNRSFGKIKAGGKVRCSRCGHRGHNKTNDECPALTHQVFGVAYNYTTY
jgi:hypothetical protein